MTSTFQNSRLRVVFLNAGILSFDDSDAFDLKGGKVEVVAVVETRGAAI